MNCLEQSLAEAVKAFHESQVFAYPTEAVFGLGCNPLSVPALERVISIKGRSANKGLILIAGDLTQLTSFLAPIEDEWQHQFDQFWPGPFSFIVPLANDLPFEVRRLLTGERGTIAVRVSNHPTVASLCRRCNSALVSTSANRSGQPALRDAVHVHEEFGDELAAIVEGEVGNEEKPSRIIDVRTGAILR